MKSAAKQALAIMLPAAHGSLAAGLSAAVKKWRVLSRQMAEAQIDYHSLADAALIAGRCLRDAIPKWYPPAQRAGMQAASEELLLRLIAELAGEFLTFRDKMIHEKNVESSVLFHTSQSISTEADLQSLLTKVVFHAGILMRTKQVFLFLAEPQPADFRQERRLQLAAWNQAGVTYGEYSLRFGEGHVGKAAQTRAPILVNNYEKASKKLPFLADVSRLLAVPIVFADEILGVLLAADTRRRARLTVADRDLLGLFASQIAATLKNMLLFQEQTDFMHELEEKNKILEEQSGEILRKSAQLVVLNEVGQQVNSSLDLPEVLSLLSRHAAESIGVDRSLVWLIDEKKTHLDSVAAYGFPSEHVGRLSMFLPDIRRTRFFNALSEQHPVEISAGQDEELFQNKLNGILSLRSMLVVPLLLKKEAIGLLAVDDTRETHSYLEDEVALVSSLANQAVLAIENARLYLQVKEQAITDGLTGLYNHRYFQLRFSEEFAHCKRYNNDLSVLMLDIDHFKQYNDTYGHIAGDLALKEIANLARASVRENDLVARYGGEEFVIILPMTNLEGAKVVAERIRQSVLQCKFLGDLQAPQVSITVSLGLSSFNNERHASREILLREADTALYEAKETGRNQTVIFMPE